MTNLQKIYKAFPDLDIGHWSAVKEGGDEILKQFMRGTVLEIGTHQGVSAATMAEYCDYVYTVDSVDYELKYKIWDALEIKNIEYFQPQYEIDKIQFIESVIDRVDVCFIDGDHGQGVFLDYAICKKCGKILFHDADSLDPCFEAIYRCVEKLPKDEVIKIKNFAYWESKNV